MDRDTVKYQELNPPIKARYVRFRPTAWIGWISLRVELYGCQGNNNDLFESRSYVLSFLTSMEATLFLLIREGARAARGF